MDGGRTAAIGSEPPAAPAATGVADATKRSGTDGFVVAVGHEPLPLDAVHPEGVTTGAATPLLLDGGTLVPSGDSDGSEPTSSAATPTERASVTLASKEPDWRTPFGGTVLWTGVAPAAIPMEESKTFCGAAIVDDSVVSRDGGLGNIYVYLDARPKAREPELAERDRRTGRISLRDEEDDPDAGYDVVPEQIEIRDCRFTSHLQLVGLHTSLAIRSVDDPSYGLIATLDGKEFWRGHTVGRFSSTTLKLDKRGVVHLYVQDFPWMSAYLIVADRTYAALTGPDGSFSLQRSPWWRHEGRPERISFEREPFDQKPEHLKTIDLPERAARVRVTFP